MGRSCSAITIVLALFVGAAGRASGQQEQKTLPQQIAQPAVAQVKQSTVYLKVTSDDGIATGSGFLAFEPGIVITNAHVVGMLEKNGKAPTKIVVYLNAGEPNEVQLPGKILAVDRTADLAVLRIDGKTLPPALTLDLKNVLFETQKLYVFGFPLGERLGKNVTVSESSVSSLRKDLAGSLQKVQVNGGMQPGNSGGPVVNSLGEVVGVSVSIIRGTQINFAIPAAKVQALMQGRIEEVKAGELFRKTDQICVPLKCTCLDPVKRVREVRVEVWTGKPTDKHSISPKQAPPKSSESYVLKYANDCWSADVPLPKLSEGQVAWVRPVLVFAKGETSGSEPRAFDAGLAVDLLPADLVVKFPDQQQRTVHLKSAMNVSQGTEKIFTRSAELDILELLGADPGGAIVGNAFASLNLIEQKGDAKKNAREVAGLLPKIAPLYLLDQKNRLGKKFYPEVGQVSRALLNGRQPEVSNWMSQIAQGYESANLVLPNKQLQPRNTWEASSPLEMRSAGSQKEGTGAELSITYTYEGLRTRSGNREALISFEGRVQSPNREMDTIDWGPVAGKLTFDLKQGFISSVKLTISPDVSEMDVAIVVDLTRVEGNPNKIELPKLVLPKAPDKVVAPKKNEQKWNDNLTGRKPCDVIEVSIADGLKMKFCWVPPGTAMLGSPATENGHTDDEKEHKFTTNGFWLGKYAVTQAEWTAVMGGNPSIFSPDGKNKNLKVRIGNLDTARFPVENLAWNDCPVFMKKLNEKVAVPNGTGKWKFAVPNEDEWEYACRGGRGNQQPFYFGAELNGKHANCIGNRPYGTAVKGPFLGRTCEVGNYETAAPHPWGLCDMLGNVWQWCENKSDDGKGGGVLRGGSWGSGADGCRSAARQAPKLVRYSDFGIRVLIAPASTGK